MTTTMLQESNVVRLTEAIAYGPEGIRSTVLLEDANCRYTLMAISSGTHIAEHASSRNATVHVIEGQGVLTLNGRDITLTPDTLIFMPAKARHAIYAEQNLAFLLILSEQSIREPRPNL
jgi:quercetin dioxygenase-like cupin family protein